MPPGEETPREDPRIPGGWGLLCLEVSGQELIRSRR
jgi:hypothetical protein